MSDLPSRDLLAESQLTKISTPSGYLPVPEGPLQNVQQGDIDLSELISIFYRRRWIMLGVVAIIVCLGFFYTITRKPIYETTAEIVVVANSAGPSASSSDISIISDLQALTRSRSIDTQAAILSSKNLLKKAYESLPIDLRENGFGSQKIPSWAWKITSKKNTDVIDITIKSYDPVAASTLANNISAAYFQRDLEKNQQATSQARKYAEEQLDLIDADLAKANSELSSYKQKTGIVSPDTQVQKIAEHIAKLQIDNDAAEVELAANKKQVSALQDQVSEQQPTIVASTTIARNPEFSAVLDKITQLNSDRARLLEEYTPGSPEIDKIDGQIKREKEQLNSLAENIVMSKNESRNPIKDAILTDYSRGVAAQASSEARVKAVGSVLDVAENKSKALPEEERVLEGLMQKVALLQRTNEMLSEKCYALRLNERAMLPNGELISDAEVPESPSYPDTKRNIMLFMILGTMISVGVAMILERLDCRIHDQVLIDKYIGVPTLSAIPEIPEDMPHLIIDSGSSSLLSESYRILRNNIAFSSIDNPVKLLAITSPGRGEGKSTTSANLAIAMAMDGKKVLLMDCDLRRPSMHRMFKVTRDRGFTSVVTGACTLEEAIIATDVENLFILPSGPLPPNPSEFLNSQHSRELFREVEALYDMVIIDCPPSVGLSDVQVISTIAEGILLLVCMDRTLRPHLQIAMRTLKQVNAPLIGTIINRMELRKPGYYNYYKYYYYYDYYSEEGDDHQVIEKSRKRRERKALNKKK